MSSKPLYTLGDVVEDMPLTNVQGVASKISQEMGEAGLLLFALRGTWCPFCVHQLIATRARYPHYTKRGVNAAFIIPEADYIVQSFVQTASRPLPFGVHADMDGTLSEALVGAYEDGTARKIGVYLLNAKREVMWQFVGYDDTYPSHTELLNAIDAMLTPTV